MHKGFSKTLTSLDFYIKIGPHFTDICRIYSGFPDINE